MHFSCACCLFRLFGCGLSIPLDDLVLFCCLFGVVTMCLTFVLLVDFCFCFDVSVCFYC